MSRADWLPDVLADAYRGVKGVRLEVYPGWNTRGKAMLFPRGVMDHHTGPGRYDPLLHYMAEGSSISPLCNVASSNVTSTNNVCRVTVVASGKANHAGAGHLDWTGTNRANYYTIGWEGQNSGREPWHPLHLEAVALGNAAILHHLGQTPQRVVDHKTYAPGRKVDRYAIDLSRWQRRVGALMTYQSDWSTTMIKHGDTGEAVRRVQRDVNVLLTWANLGPEKMSTEPRDGVGIKVDGDYGDKTAGGVSQVMQQVADIESSGRVFGMLEMYIFLRWGYYVDDQRHFARHH